MQATDTVVSKIASLTTKFEDQTAVDSKQYKAQILAADALKESITTAAALADANDKVIELNQENRIVPVGTIKGISSTVLKEVEEADEFTWFVNNVSNASIKGADHGALFEFLLHFICHLFGESCNWSWIYTSRQKYLLTVLPTTLPLPIRFYVCFFL